MREGGGNKKERDVTPANANVSQLFTTHSLAFTHSELLEVYIVNVTSCSMMIVKQQANSIPRADENITFTHMTEINCLM